MVINRYGEHLLGVVLSDDILIEKFFDFLRLQQVDSAEIRSFFLIGKFLFQNLEQSSIQSSQIYTLSVPAISFLT